MSEDSQPYLATAIPVRALDVRVRNIGGDLLLLARRQDTCELNETAAFVWRALDGRRSIDRLAEMTAMNYSIDKATAIDDVTRLLLSLESQGLIQF